MDRRIIGFALIEEEDERGEEKEEREREGEEKSNRIQVHGIK